MQNVTEKYKTSFENSNIMQGRRERGKGRERHAHPPPPFPVKSENIKFLNVKNRLEFIY